MLAIRNAAYTAAAGLTLALTGSAMAVPAFSQTFPDGAGTQEFTLDFFTTGNAADFAPTISETGGVVTAQAQNISSAFYSIGAEAFVALPGLASAGSLSDVTFQADVSEQIFGGSSIGDRSFNFVISSRDASGTTTGELSRAFTLDAPTNTLRTVGGTLDTFTAGAGTFDLNAPSYRLNLRAAAGGIGGFFDSGGAAAGISFDNVLVDVAAATPIPEPAALGLIGLGGLALRRRRN